MKKAAYVFLTAVLGTLTSLFVFGMVEISMSKQAEKSGSILETYDILGIPSFLPPYAIASFIAAGACVGVVLGFRFWEKVYVKKQRRG